MNPFQQYAAARADLLSQADDRLRPAVTIALDQYGEDGWSDPIINVAESVFAEVYEAERGDPKNFDAALGAFSDALGEALELTTEPSTPVDNAQVERITTWVATLTGSAATAATMGPDHKATWTSMRDLDVRQSHIAADGQVRTVGQRFDVGGAKLRFPGDPDGPLEEILGCRCLLLRDGGTTMAARAFSVTTEETEPQEVDGEDYDVADLPPGEPTDFDYENPRWHGVIAPEGTPSGDGRSFAAQSITTRDLPLPLRWTPTDVGQHGGAVVVGNITDVWRDNGLIKAAGNWRTDKAEADEVIGMVATEMLRGVSVDLDDIAFTVDDEVNEMGESPVTLTKGRLSAATLVDIPAFPEVFIALGDWPEGGISEQAAIIASCGCQSLDDTGTHLSLGWGAPSQMAGDPDAGEPADGEYPDFEVGEVVRVDAPSGEEVVATIVAVNDATGVATVEVEGGGTLDVPLASLKPYVSGDNDSGDGYAVGYRNVPAKERKDLADEGKALPDGSFPIANCEDLKNAIQAIGRAKDPAKAKAHIKKRASALSCGDVIPEGWAGETETFAPGTKDGPGWLTNPEDTQRLRTYWTRGAGAKKIAWGTPGDFNRCRAQLGKYVNPLFLAGTCANMHKEALGVWPGREGGGKHSLDTPSFTLVAAANRVFDHKMFEEPVLDDPRVGVWIEDDHVFGYMAQWGVCHIGVQGVCTEAPPSTTDYWYYATGVVDTDAGQVKVGQITMDTGHADLSLPQRIAAAHYDNTGSAVADVAVGENAFGIWFSGVMRPEATESQRHALRASGRVSGDWRDVRGNLEMVAALAVNVPGFPIPHVALAASGGVQISLVAAGIQAPTEVVTGPDIVSLVRSALDQIDYERSRAEKVAAARATLRAARIERARAALRG